MGAPMQLQDKKPMHDPKALEKADDTLATGVVLSPEYDEYLRLSEIFQGPRLQKLVRKLE